MKVIMLLDHPSFKGILDKDDVIELEMIPLSEDTIKSYNIVDTGLRNEKGRKIFDRVPDVIAPKGSYNGYRFKTKNGNIYTDRDIFNMFGYNPIENIFKKV